MHSCITFSNKYQHIIQVETSGHALLKLKTEEAALLGNV